MPRSRSKSTQSGSLAFSSTKALQSASKRPASQGKKKRGESNTFLNETCLDQFAREGKKSRKIVKEEFKIIDVSINKDAITEYEYIGENVLTGKLKFFTKKMICKSPQLFSSMVAFYKDQVKLVFAKKE